MKVVKRANPKSSHHKETFFSISLILWVYEMMDVQWTHCDNHFMMYTNQIIMLYTLNLYSDVCQLYLTKTGRRKESLD